jgi:hypothetical protein
MTRRIILGGVVGGIVVFFVSFLWHMVSGLGEVGVHNLPNEDAVLMVMRASIHEPGFYFFPGANMSPGRTKEQQQADNVAYNEKYKQGPTGVLIYRTGGEEMNFGKLLANQFLFGLVGALLLAWILALTSGATSYGTRALIVLVISVFSAVVFDLPYWNWYGFPMNYTMSHMAGGILSWSVAGLAMAAMVKKTASSSSHESAGQDR